MAALEATDPQTGSPRPLRILFSLLHAGYLRHYGEPIRLLAGRGHTIHLALFRDDEKDPGDSRLLERLLADCPTVTAGLAPKRRYADGWRPLAWIVRALVDVLRYADPRYEHATALRERTADKVRVRVTESRVDPLSRWLVLRVLGWLAGGADASRAARATRILLRMEAAIPTSARTDRLVATFRPDVVLASPVVEIGSPQVEFVKSAQRLRIPTAVCVASWDNLTNKGLLRVVPDRVLVWNEQQRRELEEMHGVPPARVVVTGGQKFDPWFDRRPGRSREEFARAVGLDPARQFLLYVCSSTFIAPDEVPAVRRWITALRESPDEQIRALGALVRPHPQNAAQWLDADLTDLGNATVWPRVGEYPDEGDAQAGFFDSIAYSVGVVGVNTSAQIEAGIVGKPVYTVLAPEFAATQAGTLHFHYLRHENGGFVHESTDLEQHLEQLEAGLADPDAARRRILGFMESFVRPRGLDVPVAPIVADEIEAVARLEPVAATRLPRSALRALLYPVALGMGLAATPLAVVHRLRGSAPVASDDEGSLRPRAPADPARQ